VERSSITNLHCDICIMLTELHIKEQLNVLLLYLLTMLYRNHITVNKL